MKRFIWIYCLLFTLVSCERYETLDVDLPFKSLVVTHAFVEAGSSTVVVYLTRTTQVIGTSTPQSPVFEEGAKVYFDYEGNEYRLEYDTIAKVYTTDIGLPIAVNSKCRVRVYKDGEEISGETVVPGLADVTCSLPRIDTIDYAGVPTARFTFRLRLKSGGRASLLMVPSMVLRDSSSLPLTYNGGTRVVELKEGEEFEQSFMNSYSIINQVAYIRVSVVRCDPVYAKYFNRFGTFTFGELEGPFGEPYVTFSNMSNGIGSFGSFTPLATFTW